MSFSLPIDLSIRRLFASKLQKKLWRSESPDEKVAIGKENDGLRAQLVEISIGVWLPKVLKNDFVAFDLMPNFVSRFHLLFVITLVPLKTFRSKIVIFFLDTLNDSPNRVEELMNI